MTERSEGTVLATPTRRALREARELAGAFLVSACVAVLILATPLLIIIGGLLGGFWIYATINRTTVEWPHPDVVTMYERAERQFPPPPDSSFETATITTHYDGDRWKCVQYRTEAGAADVRQHYTRLLRDMKWSVHDDYGYDGPYVWQLSVIAMDGTIRLTPWDDHTPVESASPPYRVAVCFNYEPWARPKHEASPIPP